MIAGEVVKGGGNCPGGGSAEVIQEGHRGRYVPFRGFGDGVPGRGG